MNTIILTGRLTRDPEFFTEGKPRVNFTIAVDRRSTRDGDKADFFRCVAWDGDKAKTASAINDYFSKGKPITIFGRMENEPYTDKEGRLRDSWTVKVERWEFALSDPTTRTNGTPLKKTVLEGEQNPDIPDSFEAAEDDNPF